MISNSNVSYGIYNNGTLTVTGGGIAINKENGAAIYNAGTCTISGGSMSGTAGTWGNFKTAYGIFNAKDASLSISGSPSISGRAVGDMNDPSGPQIDILTYDTIEVQDLPSDWQSMRYYNIGYYGEAGQVVVNGVSGPSDPNAEGYMEATWPCFTLTYPENAEFIYDETAGTLTYAGHTSLTYGDTNVMGNTYYKVNESGSGLEEGTDSDYDILWDEDGKTLTLNNVTIEEHIENFTYADSLFSAAVEEDITIDYFDEKRFEVRGKNIAGPLIVALDSSLDPDVPKGARLLVNERQTEVNKRGIYVFRRANRSKGFDIAIVEPLGDGSFRYVYDKANPQILSDLSGMELVGRVWEIQMLTEIDEFKTAANGSVRFNKAERKKVKLWFPIWTED